MELDRPKAAFIRRALGVHRSSRNRMTFLIAGVPLLSEDLQREYNLSKTDAYTGHLRAWDSRLADIDPNVFETEAFCSER